MNNRNICKLPLSTSYNELSVSCFVYETDEETMKTTFKLSSNRMILVEQGEGTFLFDDTPYAFQVGTLIFGFEGETFSVQNGKDVRYLYVDFQGTRGNHLYQRFGVYPFNRTAKNSKGLIPFCKECLLSTPQESIDIAGESVLLYVFSRLTNHEPKQNDILQKIIEITQERFQEAELSISLIAQKLGYNAKYLSHFFKEKMRVSYSEYLRSLRFKYAVFLFENGISSIKNVAFLSGFSDPLYFSGAFKKELGLSPKEFIANLANQEQKPQ